MTEYDDTLIDMSDVDDRLDDETETSSSEIDECRPSASENQTPDEDTATNEFHGLSSSFNNNNNPILVVVSSKYYVHNPRQQPQPESPPEESFFSEACQATPEETEQIEEDAGHSSTDCSKQFVSTRESPLLTESTTGQLSSGELSDAEEDQDNSFLTANSSEVTNTENCSILVDSLSEAPELASETDEVKQSEDSIPEAAGGFIQEEPEEETVQEELEEETVGLQKEVEELVQEEVEESVQEEVEETVQEEVEETVFYFTENLEPTDNTTTDLNGVDAETDEENIEPPQSVTNLALNPEDSFKPREQVLVNVGERFEEIENTPETAEVFAVSPEVGESALEEEQEIEETIVQEESRNPETIVDSYTTEHQLLCPLLEEETVIEEEYTIPTLTTETATAINTSSFEPTVPTESISSSSDNNYNYHNISNTTTTTDSYPQSEATTEVTMGENARVEAKLRQFEDNKKG
ncbi:hypothetical protein ElyMa_004971300 [Elysia marginata]|uniref:Uncharacterized protein n=1 Tax=Elysia marginata TaxID=1093978 RepID=A0AAV4J3U3_9GAST|nr:hypothetical protein ElyMa_004971300 [Elysia marginata]